LFGGEDKEAEMLEGGKEKGGGREKGPNQGRNEIFFKNEKNEKVSMVPGTLEQSPGSREMRSKPLYPWGLGWLREKKVKRLKERMGGKVRVEGLYCSGKILQGGKERELHGNKGKTLELEEREH